MEVIITAKGVINLEWDVQQIHMGVTVKCPQTFGCIVSVHEGLNEAFKILSCSDLFLTAIFLSASLSMYSTIHITPYVCVYSNCCVFALGIVYNPCYSGAVPVTHQPG